MGDLGWNEEEVWELLRRSPRPGPEGDRWMEGAIRGARGWLRFSPGGRWTSSHPIDPSAQLWVDLLLPLAAEARWVVGQMGQSLDGRIATESGHSHYVTGRQDIVRLHRVRALADAVVVGAGTVAADDPQLTVREVPGRSPLRVILDPRARLHADYRVFQEDAVATLVFHLEESGGGESGVWGAAERIRLPSDGGGGFVPAQVLRVLADRGVHRVLVEGGGITVSRFLQAGLLDRLHLTVAPLLIGSGRPALTLEPIQTLEEAIRPRCRTFPLGDDLLFDLVFPSDVGFPEEPIHPGGSTSRPEARKPSK